MVHVRQSIYSLLEPKKKKGNVQGKQRKGRIARIIASLLAVTVTVTSAAPFVMRIKDTGKSLEIRPDIDACLEHSLCREPVVLEISNERNALERTMLHFACYKKRTEKLGDSGKYLCRIYYSRDVETELLIQILSFGPVVKVLGPESFLKQVKERVERQQRLFAKDCSNP